MNARTLYMSFILGVCLSTAAYAAPLSSSARTVIPSAVQQIVAVDYHALSNSEAAPALKDWLLPGGLQQLQASIATSGIHPDKDIDQITFVTYRGSAGRLYTIGIAQGSFRQKDFVQRMSSKGVKPTKYLLTYLYPIGSGMRLAFLDPSTILFGDPAALRGAIEVRDSGARSLAFNRTIDDLVADVQNAAAWVVLDQTATQAVIRSSLGRGSSSSDYDIVMKRLLASDYELNLGSGISSDLNFKAADSITAAAVASLLKAGMLYSKIGAGSTESMILDNTRIESSHDMIQMHFQLDDDVANLLLKSRLISPIAR